MHRKPVSHHGKQQGTRYPMRKKLVDCRDNYGTWNWKINCVCLDIIKAKMSLSLKLLSCTSSQLHVWFLSELLLKPVNLQGSVQEGCCHPGGMALNRGIIPHNPIQSGLPFIECQVTDRDLNKAKWKRVSNIDGTASFLKWQNVFSIEANCMEIDKLKFRQRVDQ